MCTAVTSVTQSTHAVSHDVTNSAAINTVLEFLFVLIKKFYIFSIVCDIGAIDEPM